MPVVVIGSNKGGVGKTTSTILLGTTYAKKQIPITLLDADKTNHSLTRWKNAGQVPDNINVVSNVGESDIVRTIKEHDKDGTIVIVDLESVASRLTSRAISQADLVIVPVGASTIDAVVGADALKLIKEEEEVLNRSIKHAVVLTSTHPGWSTYEEKRVRNALNGSNVEILGPTLTTRATFRALFYYGGDLYSMPQNSGLEKARENAEAFADAVFFRLTKENAA